MNQSHSGFTLVELSVVVVVVALLVAGVMGGKSLIRASRNHSVITDINSIIASIDTFREKYDYYPGDMPNATRYWTNALLDGDGDNIIDKPMGTCSGEPREGYRSWRHLSLAGMIDGQFTGTEWGSSSSPCYRMGKNAPASSGGIKSFIGLGGYSFKHWNNIYGRAGNFIQFGAAGANGASPSGGASIINSPDAQAIDEKIDDGLAAYGEVFTTDGEQSNGSGQGCMDTGPNPDVYDLANTDELCTMIFWVD